MKLSEFICAGQEAIMDEWWRVTDAVGPEEPREQVAALTCHLSEILTYVGTSISGDGLGGVPEIAARYAEWQFLGGHDANAMAAEYSLLKHRVLSLWIARIAPESQAMAEIQRFEKQMDEIMLASLAHYRDRDNKARNLFLGTLVHDLKNPVNAVIQAMQLLPHLGPLNARQEEIVRQISSSARGIDELASKLIDMVRVRLGKGLTLNLERGAFAAIVGDAINEVRVAHPGCDIRFSADGDGDGDWDRTRIRELASNLVGNAAEHGLAGASIDAALRITDEGITFSVHNDGTEIPPEMLPNIFDPLVRSNVGAAVGARANLGLGLFIAREIAKAHNGTIDVRSPPGEGITFTVRLPCATPSA